MAAQRRVPLWLTALSGLLALLFLCAPARAATDFSYGAQARAAAGPGDIVLLYTGPSETEAEAKAAAAALAKERAYYAARGAEVYAFGLGGLYPDAAEAAHTAVVPDAATLGMGVEALAECSAQAGFDLLGCNFTTAAGAPVFLPGKLCGSVGVLAFIEPAALAGLPAEERAAYDMNGEVARVLIDYAAAQLRAQGASTTVLLAVCPVQETGRPWRGVDLRMQCTGIDVWIEAQRPEGAAEGPTAEGLVLYAAPGKAGALRIPGAAAEAAAPAQAQPTRTIKPAQTLKPLRTESPGRTAQPTAAGAALMRTESPAKTARPTQTVKPTQTLKPTRTVQPAQLATATQTPRPAPTGTPYSAGVAATATPSDAVAQVLNPEEEAARRALAREEGQRRQDYIPPNAVYTGGAPVCPLWAAAGAALFACARKRARKKGGRA